MLSELSLLYFLVIPLSFYIDSLLPQIQEFIIQFYIVIFFSGTRYKFLVKNRR